MHKEKDNDIPTNDPPGLKGEFDDFFEKTISRLTKTSNTKSNRDILTKKSL